MSKSLALLLVLVLAALSIVAFLPVKAEAKTIIVPDNYPTIAAAIGNATDGDAIFVKKGTYEERSIVIDKAVTLTGEDKVNTIIKGNDTGVPKTTAIVSIVADDVKVTGFTINGSIRGIDGKGNRIQIIDNIIIAEWRVNLEGSNQTIAQNIIKSPDNTATMFSPGGILFGVGYGVRCTGSYNNISANEFTGPSLECIMLADESIVYGNIVKDSGFMKVYGDKNLISNNNVTGSTGGIWIYTGSNNVVCANRITFAYGGISISSGYNNTFFANEIANCSCGVSIERLQPYLDYKNGSLEMNNTFYHNSFVDNSPQVRTQSDTNFWDNDKEGNFWSDYNGMDADGDGIGDTPHILNSDNIDHYPLIYPYDIENDAIAFPTPEPQPSPSLEPQPEPFPTALVIAASGASIAIIGVGLLVYFKKRNNHS
jgi:nitrous oxidase accessory protein